MKRTPEHQEAIRRLREVEEELQQTQTEAGNLGTASLEVRREDTQQLADYKETNKAMITLLEEIAQSQSKFASAARRVLGHGTG